MKVWMKIAASLATAALFCAAQTNSPPPPAPAPASSAASVASESQPAPAHPTPASLPVTPQPVPPPGPPAQVDPTTVPIPPPSAKKPAASDVGVAPPLTGSAGKPYVIGALDVLYVKVWNNGNLTGIYDVQDDGTVSFPLIGQLKADGLTIEQLTKLISTKLIAGDFVQSPEVSVQVTKNNSHYYYIMGTGAGHPGAFPLNRRVTISEALTAAGGMTTFANQKKIYLLRKSENYKEKHMFNYKDVLAGKHIEQDIEVENGDRIVIPE